MIITCWLNASPDPHYNRTLEPDVSQLTVLDSIGDHRAVVLTDCLPAGIHGNVEFVQVEPLPDRNPYFARWVHIANYLEHFDEFVWCVDAGDVLLLNDPYPAWLHATTPLVYVGSEPDHGEHARSVGFWWVKEVHPAHADWIDANADRPLLNPGILGGGGPWVRSVALQIAAGELDGDKTDVAAALRVLYGRWCGSFITGDRVHTPYWSYQTSHPWSIWAHK